MCGADEDGAYYWHIKSGTIQREVPVSQATNAVRIPVVFTCALIVVTVFALNIYHSSMHEK